MGRKSTYTARRMEINHVSVAYFMEIVMHYGFRDRIKSYPCIYGETFAFVSCGLDRDGSNIEHCCCVVVDALLSFFKF